MAFEAKAVANEFLDIAWGESKIITPMKIQKLTYFAHGWHLALADQPLIDEQVEAWKFGPVIRTLYSEFREYGTAPITSHASSVERIPGGSKLAFRFFRPKLLGEDQSAIYARSLLKRVWQVYGIYTAIQLSNMTHEAGSPWSETVAEYGGNPPKGTDIPMERIKRYFKTLVS